MRYEAEIPRHENQDKINISTLLVNVLFILSIYKEFLNRNMISK